MARQHADDVLALVVNDDDAGVLLLIFQQWSDHPDDRAQRYDADKPLISRKKRRIQQAHAALEQLDASLRLVSARKLGHVIHIGGAAERRLQAPGQLRAVLRDRDNRIIAAAPDFRHGSFLQLDGGGRLHHGFTPLR